MNKIFTLVDSPDENDNANYLVNRILDGSMDLSTNMIFLHYAQKLHNVQKCSGCGNCQKGKGCPLDDNLSDWRDEILQSDVFIFGATLDKTKYPVKFDNIVERFLKQSKNLNLQGKKVIIVIASKMSNSEVLDAILSVRQQFEDAGMDYADDLIFMESEGSFSAKDNEAASNRALLIGKGLRTNWRPYDAKSS